ncbi:MAG: IPT/TIG domain-containing protein [Archangiaceae bacterium]|nr:IPT/TIG domain-containing protein [Archangiaceae bacterium]
MLLLATTSCLDPVADRRLSIDLVIETIKPATVASLRGDEVTVVGRNFTGSTKVLIDGVEADVVVVRDSTELSFIAPPHAPGWADLTVFTRDDTVTSARGLRYFAQEPRFSAGRLLASTELGGKSIAGTGDLDGDGLDDVVVFDAFAGESLAFMNRGPGSGFRFDLDVGRVARRDARHLEDLDGDGRSDLVGARYFTLNRPGGWSETRVPRLPGDPDNLGPVAPRFTDVDGDGHPEAVELKSAATGCPQLYVWTFVPAASVARHSLCDAQLPVFDAADFDGDSFGDAVYVDSGGRVHIAYGPAFSDETTSAESVVRAGRTVKSLVVAEASGHPPVDLAVISDDSTRPVVVIPHGVTARSLGSAEDVSTACDELSAFVTPSFTQRKLTSPFMALCRSSALWISVSPATSGIAPIAVGRAPVVGNFDGDAWADLVWGSALGLEAAFGIEPSGTPWYAFNAGLLLPLETDQTPFDALVYVAPGLIVLPYSVVRLEPGERSARVVSELRLEPLTLSDTRRIVAAAACDGADHVLALLIDVVPSAIEGTVLELGPTRLSRADSPPLRDLDFDPESSQVVAGAVTERGRCQLVVVKGPTAQWYDPADGWRRNVVDLSMLGDATTAIDLDHDGLLDFLGATLRPGALRLAVSHFEGASLAIARREVPLPENTAHWGAVQVAGARREAGGYDVWVLSEDSQLMHIELDAALTFVARSSAQVTNYGLDVRAPRADVSLVIGDYDGNGTMDVYPVLKKPPEAGVMLPSLMLTGSAGAMLPVSMPTRVSQLHALDFDDDGLDDFVHLGPIGGLSLFRNESR